MNTEEIREEIEDLLEECLKIAKDDGNYGIITEKIFVLLDKSYQQGIQVKKK